MQLRIHAYSSITVVCVFLYELNTEIRHLKEEDLLYISTVYWYADEIM